jgi:hypothetical protein
VFRTGNGSVSITTQQVFDDGLSIDLNLSAYSEYPFVWVNASPVFSLAAPARALVDWNVSPAGNGFSAGGALWGNAGTVCQFSDTHCDLMLPAGRYTAAVDLFSGFAAPETSARLSIVVGAPVPLPAAVGLFMSGLALLGILGWWRVG